MTIFYTKRKEAIEDCEEGDKVEWNEYEGAFEIIHPEQDVSQRPLRRLFSKAVSPSSSKYEKEKITERPIKTKEYVNLEDLNGKEIHPHNKKINAVYVKKKPLITFLTETIEIPGWLLIAIAVLGGILTMFIWG